MHTRFCIYIRNKYSFKLTDKLKSNFKTVLPEVSLQLKTEILEPNRSMLKFKHGNLLASYFISDLQVASPN